MFITLSNKSLHYLVLLHLKVVVKVQVIIFWKVILFWKLLYYLVYYIIRCYPPSSRRAVTEHQLMHDRGRTIQSLKRLIWLSSAIEGLHTAQTRSSDFSPTRFLTLRLNPALVPAAGRPQPAHVESLLRDFFNPYEIPLPDRKPRQSSVTHT